MSIETARKVLEIESQAVAALAERLGPGLERAVEMLVGCSGRVIVTGMGKSGIIAQKIAATLSSTGIPSYFLHPAEAVHGDLGMVVSGDVVVALSNSGETAEIVRLLELVRRLGAEIIALSGDPDSTLAREADVHLDVAVSQEACSLDLVPTASTTAAMAMGDALAVSCYERRGFSPTDFARNHPGGRLGRRLMRVEDLMHTGDAVPLVADDAGMQQAVEEMSAKKLGMTCVVDADLRLVGILTDGDLRRRMLRVEKPLRGNAGEVAIHEPSTVTAAALATEALNIMEDKRITSLPVVDDQRRVQGVIQIHDLWRTELF